MNELIDLEEYRHDYDEYNSLLAKHSMPTEEEHRPNFESVEKILAQGFRSIYDGLTQEEKRSLWHSVLKEIHINNDNQITKIVFL